MFKRLHANTTAQLALGLVMGFCFGFLLQRGGVTRYDVILGQLLLRDWTVVKVMLSAVIVGMVGIEVFRVKGWATLHKKSGSVGGTVVGGLIFGAGFAVLGYCPGTMAGAVGQGSLDALFGGIPGMLAGAAIYAGIYPKLRDNLLKKGAFGEVTLPELLRIPRSATVVIGALLLAAFLYGLERLGY